MKDKTYRSVADFTDAEILERASNIVAERFRYGSALTSPKAVRDYLSFKMVNNDSEVFAVLMLTTQNTLIEYKEMFHGTIDSASVYPRELIKAVLDANAAAVILAHNHPSGIAEPSEADRKITTKIVEALKVIQVRVLDHIVVGRTPVSFAERGWL